MSKEPKITKRISVDFDEEQYLFLKLFIEENNTKMSDVMRSLWYRLEIDEEFANQIIDIIFED